MIVVDSSIWIDFLENSHSQESDHLQELINKNEPIATLPIILMEVLQGIREDALYLETKEKLSVFISIPIVESDYMDAVEIFRTCAKRGVSIRRGVDAIISSVCIRNRLELFHKDKDFEKIAKATRLKIYRFVSNL